MHWGKVVYTLRQSKSLLSFCFKCNKTVINDFREFYQKRNSNLLKKLTVIIGATLLITACGSNTESSASSEAGSSASPDKVYKLKLAATWGPTLTPFIDASQNMAKMAEEMSNGRLKIQVDPSNKHKAPLGILDLVKSGQYDMGHTAAYYYKGKDIATVPITTMPFGLTATETQGWYYYGGGEELTQKVFKPHNIVAFPGGNAGMQMGGWFKKEINSIDDFKGLKMRIPGFAGEVIAETGAVPTTIPAGELYTALDRGTIDALEWVGPSMDITMGFHKIAPYYYTGWHEPGAELSYFVNDKAYDKLPADLQQILKTAMRASADDMSVRTQHMNAEFLDKMKSETPNVQIKTMPPAVLAELKTINDRLVGEMVKESSLAKEIIESQQAYQAKARNWAKLADYQYIQDNQ